jgi:phosphoenolpyruvate synthase/pyruvate phosphate dikinase
MADILWLGEARGDDLSLMGRKAGQLSQLACCYQVPPGFCLTTAAYVELTGGGSGTIPTSSKLYRQVQHAYARLSKRSEVAEPGVAVRSSAVDEDGEGASFAGQHETYLNVSGAECVAEAVVCCWESARSQRALAYRRGQGLAADGISLAVLVQQMVIADVSAVAFSADPVTGDRGKIVINASWGLGESIVGGTVTPDTYSVDKALWSVKDRQIGDKRRMTVAIPGGAEEVNVPLLLRRKSVLDDARVLEIADLVLQLERQMGTPVDIECAFRAEQLYLLQCRPITTLGKLP